MIRVERTHDRIESSRVASSARETERPRADRTSSRTRHHRRARPHARAHTRARERRRRRRRHCRAHRARASAPRATSSRSRHLQYSIPKTPITHQKRSLSYSDIWVFARPRRPDPRPRVRLFVTRRSRTGTTDRPLARRPRDARSPLVPTSRRASRVSRVVADTSPRVVVVPRDRSRALGLS